MPANGRWDLIRRLKVNRRSRSHLFRLLWNPVVYFWILGNPPLIPILRHLSPVRSLPRRCSNMQCNVILPSTRSSSEWSCSLTLSDKSLIRVSCLAHSYSFLLLSIEYLSPMMPAVLTCCQLPRSVFRCLPRRDVGRDNVVGIATRYGLDGPVIESRWYRNVPHLSRPAMGPTHLPVQCVPGISRG